MLCLGRSSLDLWKTQPYWALQQQLLAILITSVIRMTSQEFGVIIVINHATLVKQKLHGKPTNWKLVEWKTNKQCDSNHFPAKAHAAETPSLSKEQLDQLLQLLKPAPLTPGTPIASVAQSSSLSCAYFLPLSAPWIIDSGASNHMTNLPHLFISYTPCFGNKKVRIANRSLFSIAGQGSIRLSDKIVLQSILHVPKLSCNLLSVSCLSKDSNCHVFCAFLCEF